MTTALQLRRGTTTQHAAFTGAVGEVTVDTDKKTAVVHDGVTAGGTPLAKEADVLARVRHDTASQGLDNTQQSNARKNINAAPLPGTNGFMVRSNTDTTVSRSLAAGPGISVTNADGTGGNPTITNTGVLSVNGMTGNVTVSLDKSDRVSKAGDTMTGELVVPSLVIQSGANYLRFSDTDWGNRYIHSNGGLIGFLGSDGGWRLYENNGGYVWTAAYGWLHDYFAGKNSSFDWLHIWSGDGTTAVNCLSNWGHGIYFCVNVDNTAQRHLLITNGYGASAAQRAMTSYDGTTAAYGEFVASADISGSLKASKSSNGTKYIYKLRKL